ncbi:MAG: imidazole glycerol phosphate synthase subunit HisH [Gammaproteobacteria bacterium]|nr:imidazole glycerol phosphate synthase subunit HisH [Gammaproteobacteria bacterium]
MQRIAVIDYGMGNLRSVVKALEHVAGKHQRVVLTASPDVVMEADRVVFPGQGAAADCMRAIDQTGLRNTIIEAAGTRPFLGICMGMQVLISHSEENNGTDCLNIYSGEALYFGDNHRDKDNNRLKVPHMGWNQVKQSREHPLWQGIADNSRFYFVHSYYLQCEDSNLTVGKCEYGFEFSAAIARDNVFAMQCHPEKSADTGLQLLTNFVNWDGQV